MNIKRDYFPEVGWRTRVLTIWTEDDVPMIDKERTSTAFERITGLKYDSYIQTIDDGDSFYYLYRGGWVRTLCPEGGTVGVVVRGEAPIKGDWISADDINRMVKELDVAMNGDKAAEQARLCDIQSELLEIIERTKQL